MWPKLLSYREMTGPDRLVFVPAVNEFRLMVGLVFVAPDESQATE